MKNTIKNIVIVGGGSAGWMTAAALARSLGTNNYQITLVESEEIGTVGVGEATVPPIMLYNNALQIDEIEFVKATNATFKLGIQFSNWKSIGHSYFHPFGFVGADMDGISFMHYWMRWVRLGGSTDYLSFNAEACAARENKFMWMDGENGSKHLPNINYAYHFDASLYARFLRKFSEDRGVTRIEGRINYVKQNPDSGYIESISLESGEVVQGDFFVDCSGFRGLLIEGVYKAGYSDWSHWLPVNRAVAAPCERSGELLPYTRATAKAAGWQWRIPLQHRTGNGYVYCDKFVSDDQAQQSLLDDLDGKLLADPRVLQFVTGVRKKFWVKNCLAIGLSSGFLEPLESTSIHLVQRAIFKLLAMFPVGAIDEKLVERFNRELYNEYNEVKDFLIAHYVTTQRDDSEFWRYVKNMDIPDSLKDKLNIFQQRCEMLIGKEEFFKETSWFAVLVGQGLKPVGYHPIADAISDDNLRHRLTKIRMAVKNRVDMMPNHADFIQRYCAANDAFQKGKS